MSSRKKSLLQIYLEYIPFWCLYQFILMLPLHTAYAISKFCMVVVYWVDPRHRNRTLQHIRYSGVVGDDEKKIRELAHKVYSQMGKLLVEIVKFKQHYSREKCRFVGPAEVPEKHFGPNAEPLIIVTAHYGNWEVAGTGWAEMSELPLVSIMRDFDNPKIGELILAHRRSAVHTTISKDGSIRDILRALKQKKNVAILADQHAGSRGIPTIFFGHEAITHTSPALLHLKTGVPILVEMTRRRDDDFGFDFIGSSLIRYQPTGDHEADIRAVTQMYTTQIEELIRQDPTQWMWAHRRWAHFNR